MPIITCETAVGSELLPVSREFSVEMFATPEGAKTIHNDQEAAEREGLTEPIAVGPQVAALIFKMMRQSFEEGWIVGGKSELTFRRPVPSNCAATARGVIAEQSAEGDKLRIVCQVWVETTEIEKAIVGTCSGLVDRQAK
jgi:acyl dehydratase